MIEQADVITPALLRRRMPQDVIPRRDLSSHPTHSVQKLPEATAGSTSVGVFKTEHAGMRERRANGSKISGIPRTI